MSAELDFPQNSTELRELLAEVGLHLPQALINFVRQDGDRRVIVGFEGLGPEGQARGYIKLYKDPERTSELWRKWQSLKIRDDEVLGAGVRKISADRGLVFLFPNDAGLRELPQVADLDKLKRLLSNSEAFAGQRIRASRSTIEVQRYKPEHRLVSFLKLNIKNDRQQETEIQHLVLRLFADGRGARLSRLSQTLRDQGLHDLIPQQLGHSLKGRVQLESRLPGRSMIDDHSVSATSFVAALERLNSSSCEGLPRRSVLSLVRTRIEEFRALARPEFEGLLAEISSLISASTPLRGRRGIVHGDLHPNQFLVHEGKLSLIDFERCSLSSPSFDLGHLLTELELAQVPYPHFAAYSQTLGRQIEEEWLVHRNSEEARLLCFGRAMAELSAASRFLRKGPRESNQSDAEAALYRARNRLRETTQSSWRWTRIHPRKDRLWPAFASIEGSMAEQPGLFDPGDQQFFALEPEDDSDLPGLPLALARGALISWRPGQRATVHDEAAGVFIKVLPSSRFPARLRVMRALNDTVDSQGLFCRLSASDEEKGLLEVAALKGVTLDEQLSVGKEEALVHCGAVLARFHSLLPKPSAFSRSVSSFERIEAHVHQLMPDLKLLVKTAIKHLPVGCEAGGNTLIHGDLHPKNFLVNDASAYLIDVEGSSLGHPAEDLGNFMAELEIRCRLNGEPESVAKRQQALFMDGYDVSDERFMEQIDRQYKRNLLRLALVYLFRRQHQHTALDLVKSYAKLALVLLPFILLQACVAFVPRVDLDQEVLSLKERVATSTIRKHDTIEIQGHFVDGSFIPVAIEIEEEDHEVELKSDVVLVEAEFVELGNLVFWFAAESEAFGLDGERLELEALKSHVGEFAKAEGILRNEKIELRKISLRQRGPEELDRLQAQVETLDSRRGRMTVAGLEVPLDRRIPVFWDVDGVPAPSVQDQDLRSFDLPTFDRILRTDDDDRRAGRGLRLADWLHVGGELQWDLEWRKNHNLRDERKRDRLVTEISTKLELSFDINERTIAYTQLRAARDFEIYDQSARLDFDLKFSVEQALVLFLDFPLEGMALEVGRQKFDQGREWAMDDNLDGIRLFWNLDFALLEASLSSTVFDASPEDEEVINFLGAAHIDLAEESELFLYALHRNGGQLIELDRWHFGASLESEVENFTLFLDVGYAVGKEDQLKVEGYGFDIMALYRFEDSILEPSLYLGFAYGSGDKNLGDGKNSSFRQTGLNDNNDKLNGVTSFRYLGELVRPELSNLMVLTAGFGLRPSKNSSVDFVMHQYRQVEAAARLADTRLRLTPQGLRRQLGTELDLIIGLEDWRPLEIEIVIGWFRPGQAFEHGSDEAWFMTFQAEWNF